MRHLINILVLAAATLSLPMVVDRLGSGEGRAWEGPLSSSASFCTLTYNRTANDNYRCELDLDR